MVTHSTPEACRLTGASFREIDYWDRVGVLHPTHPANGSGSRRLWSDRDIAEIRVVVALRGLGCPLRRIGEFLDLLRTHPGSVLVADADGGIEACDSENIVDAITRSGGAALVLTAA